MATSQIVDNFSNTVIDTVEIAYTAPSGSNVAIESFTCANTSSVNASYSAHIVSSGGSVTPQIQDNIVVWGENDLGIGIVGQVIPAGGTLRFESSATASLYFTVTGRAIDNT